MKLDENLCDVSLKLFLIHLRFYLCVSCCMIFPHARNMCSRVRSPRFQVYFIQHEYGVVKLNIRNLFKGRGQFDKGIVLAHFD